MSLGGTSELVDYAMKSKTDSEKRERKKRAEDLARRSEARRKQLYEETQENAQRRRKQEHEKRKQIALERELKRAREELLKKEKNEKLRQSRAIVGSSHLVAAAHKFIASTEEAIMAMQAADAGILPSSDEDEEFELV